MKNLHTRILILNYFEDEVPIHDTKEEQDKWYAALGRMVAYGLRNERNRAEHDTMQFVSMTFDLNPTEIDACYSSEVARWADGEFTRGPAEECLDNLYENLTKKGQQFVMGAVLHSDGEWGFHS